ncbi:glycosyltransferase family 2 protein [Candidatus Woesearchaeota archaeon]|nr:glycosyltransferase family 2 protein [Candidatus Woesearchaeota archaeon]
MKVTAVVPVYNEEKTIKGVLEVLSSSKDIDEILVIDDGSTDKTPDIIKRLQANKMEYIKLKRNIGKDNAIRKCAKNINSEIVMIFDSDLIGFEKHHIENMLNALVEEKAGMVIGLRDKGNFLANIIMPYFPLTGGERALRTNIFKEIIKIPFHERWGLEWIMNDYLKKKKLKIAKIRLEGVDHIGLQTKKYGIMAFLNEIYSFILTKIRLFGVKYD